MGEWKYPFLLCLQPLMCLYLSQAITVHWHRHNMCCWTCCMAERAFIFSLIQEMKERRQLHADEGCINKTCSVWPQNKYILIQWLSLQHYPHFPLRFEHLQPPFCYYFQQKQSKQYEDKHTINFSMQHTSSVVSYIQNKTHRKGPRRPCKR